MDWLDKTREDTFFYEMVDPFSLDASRGYLEGVISGSPSLTFGYDTDTRVSGSLEAIPKNYIDYSLIRIYHEVKEWGYTNELGTFFVSDRNGTYNYKTYKRNFNLSSMLCRVSDDALISNFCIPNGSSAKQMLINLLNTFNVPYTMESNVNDRVYTGAIVYEIGENALSTMLEIASEANLEINVNGHGITTITNSINPTATTTPVFYFADNDGSIDGDITETIDYFGVVNRVIVHSDKTENDNTTTVSGFADRDANSIASYNKLGRRNTAVESITDLEPFTDQNATNQASSLLINDNEDATREFSFDGVYIPNDTGSVISLMIEDQEHICTIKNKTVKLQPGMMTSYTVKEV